METLKIMHDEDPQSPREWSVFGKMVCWHPRHKLGDEMPGGDPREWFKEHIEEKDFWLPLYLYDHSGLTRSTGKFSCPWDSGQVGWIYISKQNVLDSYGKKRVSKKLKEEVYKQLNQDVKTYDQYLRGAVWGYMYKRDIDGKEEEDSCWGFFGDSLEETGIKDHVPAAAIPLLEDAWDKRE